MPEKTDYEVLERSRQIKQTLNETYTSSVRQYNKVMHGDAKTRQQAFHAMKKVQETVKAFTPEKIRTIATAEVANERKDASRIDKIVESRSNRRSENRLSPGESARTKFSTERMNRRTVEKATGQPVPKGALPRISSTNQRPPKANVTPIRKGTPSIGGGMLKFHPKLGLVDPHDLLR